MATEIVNITEGINVSGFASGLTTFFYWALILGTVGFLIWYIWKVLQYKHDFIIHDMTREGTITIKDKLWIKKLKNGTIVWLLKKSKQKVPIPNKSAISRTNKGKYFIEAYRTIDGEFHYIETKHEEEDGVGNKFPLRNSDKEFYAQEVVDAEKYKEKKTWQDVAIVLAPYLAIVIIFVCFLAFFDQVLEPAKELTKTIAGATSELGSVLESMKDCSQSFTSQVPTIEPPN